MLNTLTSKIKATNFEKILRELLGKSGIFKEAMAIMKGELLLYS